MREYRKKRDFSVTAEPSPEAPHRGATAKKNELGGAQRAELGDWHFVRTSRTQGAKNQWLMFKAKDDFADPKYDVVG